MRFQLEEYHRGITDEQLLAELQRIALHLGKSSVSRDENDDLGQYGSTTYLRRFGSWFNALDKAGLQKTRTPMNVPIEDLFRNLEEVWTKLGRQPRYAEVQKPLSLYSVGTYENRFGTWRKALQQFVAFVNDEPNASSASSKPDDVIATESAIRERGKKRGVNWRLRFLIMRRDSFRCASCGRSPASDPTVILHIDHIKPWSRGGDSAFENLQTLCSICNIGKSDLE